MVDELIHLSLTILSLVGIMQWCKGMYRVIKPEEGDNRVTLFLYSLCLVVIAIPVSYFLAQFLYKDKGMDGFYLVFMYVFGCSQLFYEVILQNVQAIFDKITSKLLS